MKLEMPDVKMEVSEGLCDSSSTSSDSGTSQSSQFSHDFLPFINVSIPTHNATFDTIHCGVPTRTTSTLTPTTLRNIEQALQDVVSRDESHSREAGFVPPLVEPSQPTPAQTQNFNCYPVHCEDLSITSDTQHKKKKKGMGGRRPNEIAGETVEEEQKRKLRRERNKMAAARCRKRRIDHTAALEEETSFLEQRKQELREEYEELIYEKDRLERALKAHECTYRRPLSASSDIKPMPKPEMIMDDEFVEKEDCESTCKEIRPSRPNSLAFVNNKRPNSLPIFSEPKPRPNSLAFKTVETPAFMKNPSEIAGVPITTPSTGIPFNFDSLMEGGTGLTPVSTPMISLCSSQIKYNASTPDIRAPDIVPSKFVSL